MHIKLPRHLLPNTLVGRVFSLYATSLLMFFGIGLGLFYSSEFSKRIEDEQLAAERMLNVAAQSVVDSAIIGDYDTITKTLERTIARSHFAQALFIDTKGGIVRVENKQQNNFSHPKWLEEKVQAQLFDINHNIAAGSKDYGVLRITFAANEIASEMWHIGLMALALSLVALASGIVLIRVPLNRWLGNFDRVRANESEILSGAVTINALLDQDAPAEIRSTFDILQRATSRLFEQRERALESLRLVLATLPAPSEISSAAITSPQTEDLEVLTLRVLDLISARKVMEANIKATGARLREVTEGIPIAVFQLHKPPDGDKTIPFCSPALHSICGITHDEAMADAAAVLSRIHPDDAITISHTLSTSARSGEPWALDFRLIHKLSGDLVWVHAEAQTVRESNGGVLWNGYMADISEAKRASEELRRAKEGAESANRAKSNFLANMSHEIRTPMNGVIGMTDLALDTQLDSVQRDYLNIVKSSAQSLMTVINDILDFSKIEAGKLLIEKIPFDLEYMVRETIRALDIRALAKGITLTSDIAPGVPATVTGDPGRLRQILINLIGNAIKFTDHGHILVRIQVGDVQASPSVEGPMVHFTISDTGIGIPASKLSAIFDAFSQEDSTITRKYGGTGLGLTISARLVDALEGRIWVDSQVGHGSQFHFAIPLPESIDTVDYAAKHSLSDDIPEPTVQGAALAPQFPPTDHPAALDVLLVEDYVINQKLATTLLQRWGHRVTLAENGQLALEALASHRFDLVLMDMMMPVMDGLEATQLFRAREQAPRTPIIAMTANVMQGDKERCLASGMDDYISKPFEVAQLKRVLSQYARPAENTHAVT